MNYTVMLKHPWLYPEQHAAVVQMLLKWGLIKYDNERKLPLKSGGRTDTYINLRDARSRPQAIPEIAKLFSFPIRLLRAGGTEISRFVEVPDSVSCFAGHIATETNLPFLTIREQAKEGRVAKAKVIGHPNPGEQVVILDDVITDGASKITPFRECQVMDLIVKALVVLVDRQQGWQEALARQGVSIPVWAGMTLHDVRRQLIQVLGVMERCDLATEAKNPVVVALDGKSWEDILPLIDVLRPTGCILKVNDLIWEEGTKWLLPNLSVYGRILADFKFCDIPNTVGNGCKLLQAHPPWAITVHGSGGGEMVKSAVGMVRQLNLPTKILVVTVLTSLEDECWEIYRRRPEAQVKKIAAIAHEGGADGFVCSPLEAKFLRRAYSGAILVTPGVRSLGGATQDQARVATPQEAIAWGADHIVMGRQMLGNPDPVGEVRRVITDELKIQIS